MIDVEHVVTVTWGERVAYGWTRAYPTLREAEEALEQFELPPGACNVSAEITTRPRPALVAQPARQAS